MKEYSLIGVDGNAFAIMGYVRRAMRNEQCQQCEIDDYIDRATSGDYENLLAVSQDEIDRLNWASK